MNENYYDLTHLVDNIKSASQIRLSIISKYIISIAKYIYDSDKFEIYYYGSYAKKTSHLFSDVDIVVFSLDSETSKLIYFEEELNRSKTWIFNVVGFSMSHIAENSNIILAYQIANKYKPIITNKYLNKIFIKTLDQKLMDCSFDLLLSQYKQEIDNSTSNNESNSIKYRKGGVLDVEFSLIMLKKCNLNSIFVDKIIGFKINYIYNYLCIIQHFSYFKKEVSNSIISNLTTESILKDSCKLFNLIKYLLKKKS